MKEKLAEFIIACDEELYGVVTHKSMSPSSSIEEVAEYVSENISNDFFAALMNEIMKRLNDYVDVTPKKNFVADAITKESFTKYCDMMRDSRYRYNDIVDSFAKATICVNEVTE